MKLVATYHEERPLRRVHDAAKTPLQRLLLSGVLPACKQEELKAVAQALDSLRLIRQLEDLQHAVFRCAVGSSPLSHHAPATSLLVFAPETCMTEPLPVKGAGSDPAPVRQDRRQELQENRGVLDWPRTSKDPFAGEWEQILAWMVADPTRSSGDIFRQLQDRIPGRYQPLDIRTLQRGMRKIRAYLLQTREEQWQHEVVHGDVPEPVKPMQDKPVRQQEAGSVCASSPALSVDLSPKNACEQPRTPSPSREGNTGRTRGQPACAAAQVSPLSDSEQDQASQVSCVSPTPVAAEREESLGAGYDSLAIEQAIQSYLQHQRRAKRSPKTLEWHRTALGQFQQYLLTERHLVRITQITAADINTWFAFLHEMPTATGKQRVDRTIETYARKPT